MFENFAYHHEVLPPKLWSVVEFSRLLLGLPAVQDPSPISRLSPDILGEIFKFSLRSNGFQSLNQPGSLMLEPLTLSHVNSRWRDIAICTPSLWSTIWVDRPREAHVPMVKLWIQRSRQCPLILYLRQTAAPLPGQQLTFLADPREYELTDEILLLLKNHLHRWKRVTFLFHKEVQRPLLYLPPAPAAAPQLEHVHMTVETWDSDSSLATERIMYSYDSVKSVVVHESMSQNFLRWDRLTVLDSSQLSCSLDSHLNVLRHCPFLHRAEIRCTQVRIDKPFVATHRRSRLLRLVSLTVYADRVDIAPLLDGLLLPQLEGLVLRYDRAPRCVSDSGAFRRLLKYSSCTLQRFSLKDTPTAPDADFPLSFLRPLRMAPLTELYMQLDMTDAIFKFLTLPAVEDGLPRVLPNLQTISLKDYRGEHIDDLELYRMIISRFAGPGPDRNGRYSGALRHAYFHLRVKGHSASPVLPLLIERCRERLDLRIYLDGCDDLNTQVGWYTSPPIPGGYLTEG